MFKHELKKRFNTLNKLHHSWKKDEFGDVLLNENTNNSMSKQHLIIMQVAPRRYMPQQNFNQRDYVIIIFQNHWYLIKAPSPTSENLSLVSYGIKRKNKKLSLLLNPYPLLQDPNPLEVAHNEWGIKGFATKNLPQQKTLRGLTNHVHHQKASQDP